MKIIHFKKTFLSGNLKGLTVNSSYSVPNVEKLIANHIDSLKMATKKSPKLEMLTNNKYFVTDISVG